MVVLFKLVNLVNKLLKSYPRWKKSFCTNFKDFYIKKKFSASLVHGWLFRHRSLNPPEFNVESISEYNKYWMLSICRHWAKCFACIDSFTPVNKPHERSVITIPFYSWKNWDTERLQNLPRDLKLGSERAKIRIQGI